jgi:hypothetical protein
LVKPTAFLATKKADPQFPNAALRSLRYALLKSQAKSDVGSVLVRLFYNWETNYDDSEVLLGSDVFRQRVSRYSQKLWKAIASAAAEADLSAVSD